MLVYVSLERRISLTYLECLDGLLDGVYLG
jgi:hypothetical protein